jgi:A/G-specific adenine glycosylase
VGRYTAAAIASITADTRLPILEGNTRRLYCRLMAFRGSTDSAAAQKPLWSFAESILPRRDCGAFNQALMELGATICTPKSPRCEICPVAAMCLTHERGLQEQIPAPRRRPRVEHVTESLVVIRRHGKLLLTRHAEGRRWARLWDFIRFPLSEVENADSTREIGRQTTHRTGLVLEWCIPLVTVKHSVTRFRITLACYEATAKAGRLKMHDSAETRWVTPDDLPSFALNATARRLVKFLDNRRDRHD